MTEFGGYMGKVLLINLTTKEVSEYPWSDEDRQKYLGGNIMATKIISDLVSPEISAFDEGNVLVFSTGPFSLTNAPSSSRFSISLISPLTNCLETSNCGGSFGLELKKANIDALIIMGKAQRPTWIKIRDNEIEFNDASCYRGKSTQYVLKLVTEPSIVIGPAGENLIEYSNLITHDRSFGKHGEGTVFGSKQLKGISVFGTNSVRIHEPLRFEQSVKEWRSSFNHFSDDEIELKPFYCSGCFNHCGRMYQYKKNVLKKYEFDQLMLLGYQLGVSDFDVLFTLKEQADFWGIDFVSFMKIVHHEMKQNELTTIESTSQLMKMIAKKEKKISLSHSDKKKKRPNELKESFSALGICSLAINHYRDYEIIMMAFNLLTGMNKTVNQLSEIGKMGYNLTNNYNTKRRTKS